MVTASYPGGVISYTTKKDRIDVVDDDHVNQLQAEQIALQQYVGTNPHQDRGSLDERITAFLNPSGYLYSTAGDLTPTHPGQMWHDSDADQIKFIKPDGTRLSIGGGLSNVIYMDDGAWLDGTNYNLSQNLLKDYDISATLIPTGPTVDRFNFWQMSVSTSWVLMRPPIKWYKISGVNTLRCRLTYWGTYASAQWHMASFGISAAGTAATPSLTGTGPSAAELTLDISALANGTMYDIDFWMRRQTTTSYVYLGAVTIWGE